VIDSGHARSEALGAYTPTPKVKSWRPRSKVPATVGIGNGRPLPVTVGSVWPPLSMRVYVVWRNVIVPSSKNCSR